MKKEVPREGFVLISDNFNVNRRFLKKVRAVVDKCKVFGISFRESEDDVALFAKILRNID